MFLSIVFLYVLVQHVSKVYALVNEHETQVVPYCLNLNGLEELCLLGCYAVWLFQYKSHTA
jgi:hypothetical protein